MSYRFTALLALGLLGAGKALAQDPQFTQFYAAPLYHNPAMAGSAHSGRAILNYRNQWPSIPGAFVTYAASVDNYWKRYNSGAGLIIVADRSGSGRLMSASVGGQYAYEMPITRTISARAGFEFAYRQRTLDFFRLVWRDQLQPGLPQAPTTREPLSYQPAHFFDVSSGGLIYSRHWWVGLGILHMNQPNQSITAQNSRLPIRYTLQVGGNIPIAQESSPRPANRQPTKSITPALLYKRQADFQQLDLGMYLNVQPIVVGAWYRGLPVLRDPSNGRSQDAMALLIGLKMPQYTFGYSYDVTLSKLGPSTGGAHEISMSYLFETNQRYKRRPTAIPCPKF